MVVTAAHLQVAFAWRVRYRSGELPRTGRGRPVNDALGGRQALDRRLRRPDSLQGRAAGTGAPHPQDPGRSRDPLRAREPSCARIFADLPPGRVTTDGSVAEMAMNQEESY